MPRWLKYFWSIITHIVLAYLMLATLLFYEFTFSQPVEKSIFIVAMLIPYLLMVAYFTQKKDANKTIALGGILYLLLGILIALVDQIPSVQDWASQKYFIFEVEFWDFAFVALVVHYSFSLISLSWLNPSIRKVLVKSSQHFFNWLAHSKKTFLVLFVLVMFIFSHNTLIRSGFCLSSPCGVSSLRYEKHKYTDDSVHIQSFTFAAPTTLLVLALGASPAVETEYQISPYLLPLYVSVEFDTDKYGADNPPPSESNDYFYQQGKLAPQTKELAILSAVAEFIFLLNIPFWLWLGNKLWQKQTSHYNPYLMLILIVLVGLFLKFIQTDIHTGGTYFINALS